MDLAELLEAARNAEDAAARQQAVRDALAGVEFQLTELETAVTTQFATLSQPGDAGFTSETVLEMNLLADVIDGARAEQTAREQNAQAAADLAARIGTPPAPAVTPAPAAPATGTPLVVPVTVEVVPAPAAPAAPAAPSAEVVPVAQPVTTVVTEPAFANQRNTVPLGALPVQLPQDRQTSPFTITAAADLPGHNLGANLEDLDGLTEAVMARFQQLGRAGGDFGSSRAGIASIQIERDPRLVARTQHDWKVVEFACDETRLPGGSLLAAGTPGWCAPAEISYDFCPVAVVDGLVDLPSVTAQRGSLIYPQSPEFHTIYSGTGFCFTAAQIDDMQTPGNTTVKPCYQVPCPDTTSLTLDPCGLCIQASILHERSYPELIRYTVQQSIVAHAHQMNARTISQMVALATAVDMTANTNLGPGAMATALESIEMQVEWLRYRMRLGVNFTMELVAPVWMRGILRADLSKRMGGGSELLDVDDAALTNYLASRGVRVQWVLDWQDAFSDPATTGSPAVPVTIPQSTLFGGGAAPQTAWPTTAQVLIYPAGTFFLARMDIINLEGGLLDSTLLRKNERIALFLEEALKVGKRCYQASVVKIPLCASGQTGSGAWVNCATAPKVAV